MYDNIIHCRIKWPKNMDKIARDLVSKMLVIDTNMRITLKEIKRHMFFNVSKIALHELIWTLYTEKYVMMRTGWSFQK